MGKKRTMWKKMDGIELTAAPHPLSSRMKSSSASTASATTTTDDAAIPYATSTADLTVKQVDRLRAVLSEKVDIHGRGNFPTISVPLVDIVTRVRQKLRDAQMPPKCVKINGGAASYVISTDDFEYADLDIIFSMEDGNADSFEKVRAAVFETIMDLMPGTINKTKINADTLKDVYVRKMVKVSGEDDRWSLFSLHNDFGRCIELKFVDRMRRQFEFSVDSFQITLDPLLDDFASAGPVVKIESVFGDISQAMNHLQERLIDTRKPEEIRGGGLLKYCHLLVRGYKAAKPGKCRQLERYMCSRFFIDFPDVNAQEQKLRNYLENHFGSNSDQWSSCGEDTDSEASTSIAPSSLLALGQAKYDYLMLLHRVIGESTVCLMTHDRKLTLAMIDRLAFQVSLSIMSPAMAGHTPKTTLVYLPRNTNQWIPVV